MHFSLTRCLKRNIWNPASLTRICATFFLAPALALSIVSFPDSEAIKLAETKKGFEIWLCRTVLALLILELLIFVTSIFCTPLGAYGIPKKVRIADFVITIIMAALLITFGVLLNKNVSESIEKICGPTPVRSDPEQGETRVWTSYKGRSYLDCTVERSKLTDGEKCNCDTKVIIKYNHVSGTGVVTILTGASHLLILYGILMPRKENMM